MTIADKPGYRRSFRIVPSERQVTSALEDDIHCMKVVLRHDGQAITGVEAEMVRAPWTSCPGADAVLQQTFTGMTLDEATARGGKKLNCTHLYDLAELAAAHARDDAETAYDIFVTDPEGGSVEAELRCNGETLLEWRLKDDVLLAPEDLAGCAVFNLRERIGGLTGADREAARILQWACLVAHGRHFPWHDEGIAPRLPPSCHGLQPERAIWAKNVGERFDFSRGGRRPLEGVL